MKGQPLSLLEHLTRAGCWVGAALVTRSPRSPSRRVLLFYFLHRELGLRGHAAPGCHACTWCWRHPGPGPGCWVWTTPQTHFRYVTISIE